MAPQLSTTPIVPTRLGYTVTETATLLGVSPKTIYNLLTSGQLSSFKVNGCRRIAHDALHAFVERAEVVPTPPDR